MPSTNGPDERTGAEERRSSPRYPLESDVGFRVFRGRHVLEAGTGRTVNMSSSGILFESTKPLPVGERIELAIAWPVRLGDTVRLKLCIAGRTVRSSGNSCAVRIQRRDFRTASIQSGPEITRRW